MLRQPWIEPTAEGCLVKAEKRPARESSTSNAARDRPGEDGVPCAGESLFRLPVDSQPYAQSVAGRDSAERCRMSVRDLNGDDEDSRRKSASKVPLNPVPPDRHRRTPLSLDTAAGLLSIRGQAAAYAAHSTREAHDVARTANRHAVALRRDCCPPRQRARAGVRPTRRNGEPSATRRANFER